MAFTLCALIVPAMALGYSVRAEKQYTATATLLFRDAGLDQKLFDSAYLAPSRDPNREAATNLRLASLRVVAVAVSRDFASLSTDDVLEKVSVEGAGQSDVVAVEATDSSPELAARLANSWARQFIAFRRDADRSKIREAQDLVERELQSMSPERRLSPQGQSLEAREQQLQILSSLQTGNAELAEAATVPTEASSPKPLRSAVLGLFGGLLLAFAVAFLAERLDRKVHEVDDLTDMTSRPLLASIPIERAALRSREAGRSIQADAFRMLRANLRYFNATRRIGSVAITSAEPGEGKSTTSLNLARATAQSGAKTLLIEADLRRSSLRAALGVGPGFGLADVLAGTVSLSEVLHSAVPASGDHAGSLDVLFAGPPPPNPADLLDSEAMRALYRELKDQYEFIVIDTPPTSVVADAVPLLTMVDGVIVVARLNVSHRHTLRTVFTQLQNLEVSVLGVVANAVPAGQQYSYQYYAADDARSPVTGSATIGS